MLVDKTAVDYLKEYFDRDQSAFAIGSIMDIFCSSSIFKQKANPTIYETSYTHSFYDPRVLMNQGFSREVSFEVGSKINNPDFYTVISDKDSKYVFSPQIDGYKEDHYFSHIHDLLQYNEKGKLSNSFLTKDLLFPGVRYIGKNMVIFEMPPTYKHIDYKEAYREDDGSEEREIQERSYYLPIPWQIYIASFDDKNMRVQQVQMYFSNSAITSFDHQIHLSPLLNFYSNGVLCRPFFSSMEDIEKYSQNISGVMASAYDWIWNSGFNFDIRETVSEFVVSGSWKKMLELSTLNDPAKQAAEMLLSQVVVSRNDLAPSVVRTVFSLWASVPLERILECTWISFCKSETWFSYEFRNYHNENWDEVSKWVKENTSYVLIPDIEDESDLPEDWDEEGESKYITISRLYESTKYYKWVVNKLHFEKTTLFDAWRTANSFVNSSFSNKDSKHGSFVNFLMHSADLLTKDVFKTNPLSSS